MCNFIAMEPREQPSLFDIAKAFVLHTGRSVFLTGRAGTGKTTFLKHIKEQTAKNMVIVAPTGVAAINAGGVTLHSFFQLPFGAFLPGSGFGATPASGTNLPTLLSKIRFNKDKRKLLEELELLVIDEVSMLRADTLDAIDGVLRHFRKKQEQPFGGVQMLFIGDLYQLPPVVKDDEWNTLSAWYRSMFFFDALAMKELQTVSLELDTIYRQSDPRFIALLNAVRNNCATDDDLQLLNKYYDPYFYPDPDEGYIMLTSHNHKADKINQGALAKLNNEAFVFEGELSGDFNDNALPVEKKMTLKEGAQIMFIKNDKGEQRRYYNGKIGTITRIKNREIYVRFPGEREELQVEQEVWRNIRYKYNEAAEKIEEEELGSYKQYPIRLAWAVTIHKSQGLTFERAIVDAGQSFAPGQVYVALSRLRSLQGLVLASEITPAAIHTESSIAAYTRDMPDKQELWQMLQEAQRDYIAERLLDTFSWRKMLTLLQEHHQEYNNIKIPQQEAAFQWSVQMLRQTDTLEGHSNKFIIELKQLLQRWPRTGITPVHERVKAAGNYFLNKIDDQLLAAWQQHFDETKAKANTKKYLRSLQPLYTQIIRKKQQLEQAMTLTQGLEQGKDITLLLEHYQNTRKHIPQPPNPAMPPAAKQDEQRRLVEELKKGKSIALIAAEWGQPRSTVETQLLELIPTGQVSLDQIVAPEKQMVIQDALQRYPAKTAASIRELIGNACSYYEIQAVMAATQQNQ